MGRLKMGAMFLMLFFVSIAKAEPETVYDIRDYDGTPNMDITEALIDAFGDACEGPTSSKVLIPKGTFLLGQVKLNGPCRKPIKVEVQGTLTAQTDPEKMEEDSSWVAFQHIDHLTLFGGGTFDGQGPKAWATCGSDSYSDSYCKKVPSNLRFHTVTNGFVEDITSKDSKQSHVTVKGCKNLSFERLTISAPKDSINTKGIHVFKSTGISITDSNVATGDDCVSLGDGSQQIRITNVICGSGHGISVGSLGKYDNEERVVEVVVQDCTISNTMNGIRINTWPASYEGYVSNLLFENIIMNNVSNPVLIDQLYCPSNQCNAKIPSQVKINNVRFKNIRGTSATPVAVKLACSNGFPCQGVEIADIDLTYNGNDASRTVSQCSNVEPRISGKMNPPACSSPATTP